MALPLIVTLIGRLKSTTSGESHTLTLVTALDTLTTLVARTLPFTCNCCTPLRGAEGVRRAYELNAPLFVKAGHQEPGTEPARQHGGSWFMVAGADHIVAETIKVADDGDGLIVRLYEAHNMRGPASLRFARPVASAVETDLLEREIGPVVAEGAELRFEVRPFEVKTFRVRF